MCVSLYNEGQKQDDCEEASDHNDDHEKTDEKKDEEQAGSEKEAENDTRGTGEEKKKDETMSGEKKQEIVLFQRKVDDLEELRKARVREWERHVQSLTVLELETLTERWIQKSPVKADIQSYLDHQKRSEVVKGCSKCRKAVGGCEKCAYQKALIYVMRNMRTPHWWHNLKGPLRALALRRGS